MHILDAPQPIIDAFYKMHPNELRPIVKFVGRARVSTTQNADGSWNFTGFQNVEWDLSDRVSRSNPIKIAHSKPLFPVDGNENFLTASNITVNLVNTDTYAATIQDGGILDIQSIEGGEIFIFVQVQGSQPFELYRGRIIGTPRERKDRTVINIRSTIWDSLSGELRFDRVSAEQNTYSLNNGLFSSSYDIGQSANYKRGELWDAYSYFASDARVFANIDNSNPDQVQLSKVDVVNGAPLGTYTIEFITSQTYQLTTPTGDEFTASIGTDLDSDFVGISPDYWINRNTEVDDNGNQLPVDAQGTKITFVVSFVASGNPITLIKLLLRRGFLADWGTLGGANLNNLRVDWSTFNELEENYNDSTVYVCETNDNNAFENVGDAKPKTCIFVAQRIADHIGATLVLDLTGVITVKEAVIRQSSIIWEYTDAEAINTVETIGTKKSNYVLYNYGKNDKSNDYTSVIEADLRANSYTAKQIKTLNFPYYKKGVNEPEMKKMLCIFNEKVANSLIQLSIKLLPNMAFTLMPGDFFRLVSTERPVLAEYVQVIEVSKQVSNDLATIKAVKVSDPKEFAKYCQDTFCNSEFH